MTPDEYRKLTNRYLATPESGKRLPAEAFMPDLETAGAWRHAFTQGKAEGEGTTIEWLSLDDLPLEKVGALKGPHMRPKGAGKPAEMTTSYSVYERNDLSLCAAYWNSIGRRAPPTYKVVDATSREIFGASAYATASAELRVVLSTAQKLGEVAARAAMMAACRQFHEDMRTATRNNESPDHAVAACLPTLRAQVAQINREAEAGRETTAAAPVAAATDPASALLALLQGSPPKREANKVIAPGTPNGKKRQRRGNNRGGGVPAAGRGAGGGGKNPMEQLVELLKAKAEPPKPPPPPKPTADPLAQLVAALRGTATPDGKPKCRDFLAGKCSRGDACRFSHE